MSTTTTTTRSSTHRARWAAIGAAVAVSLGAGGIGIARAATSPAGAATYIPITPCRLADTRPAPDTIGPRATQLPANEPVHFVGTGSTDVGNCADKVPTNATALNLNVTALFLTGSPLSFLTFFPKGEAQPTTAGLTMSGGGATENAVTVGLGADDSFSVVNGLGSVDVIIDINGYFTDSFRISTAEISNESGISTNYTTTDVTIPNQGILAGTWTSVNSTAIRVPSDGYLNINVTGTFAPGGDAQQNGLFCRFALNGTRVAATVAAAVTTVDYGGSSTLTVPFSGHATIPVAVADNPALFTSGQAVELQCQGKADSLTFYGGTVQESQITATFHATNYKPGLFIFDPGLIDPGFFLPGLGG